MYFPALALVLILLSTTSQVISAPLPKATLTSRPGTRSLLPRDDFSYGSLNSRSLGYTDFAERSLDFPDVINFEERSFDVEEPYKLEKRSLVERSPPPEPIRLEKNERMYRRNIFSKIKHAFQKIVRPFSR